jgi:hypothetical protein
MHIKSSMSNSRKYIIPFRVPKSGNSVIRKKSVDRNATIEEIKLKIRMAL